MQLETNGFESAFAVDIDPEFPASGEWQCEVVGFGFEPDGHAVRDVESRSGERLVVRVEPVDGAAWVAMFASGGPHSSFRGVFATPAPTKLAVIVDGLACVVERARPAAKAALELDGVESVAACGDPPLLLLSTSLNVVALGPSGVAWSTPRLSLDGLQLRHADSEGIICWCDNTGIGRGWEEIVLDPISGAQVAGFQFNSFWPPYTPPGAR